MSAQPEPTTSSDIVHRPAHSLDTIATLCEGCDGYWPCEQAGHTGFYWDRGQGDAEDDGWMWVCHDSCPHRSHLGSSNAPDNRVPSEGGNAEAIGREGAQS